MTELLTGSPSVAELITQANTVAVIPSKVAGADAFSAAVGLYRMLLAQDKKVKFIHTGKIPEECQALISQEEIDSGVTRRELDVAIDYTGLHGTQARYASDHDVLHVFLYPVPKDFDLNRVKAKITGLEFDVAIVVGAQVMEDLGQTYFELKEQFSKSKVINIDNTDRNSRFGNISVIDSLADSLSLLVLQKTSEWGLKPDKKAASALLTGITHKDTKVANPA